MNTVMYKLRDLVGKDWVTPLFMILFLVSWTLNAFKYSNFDLVQLQTMYAAVRIAALTEHTVNSKYNSEDGKMPIKIKEGEV